MDYIRDRESNIPFSLHDSRILQIEINETTLTLKLDRYFNMLAMKKNGIRESLSLPKLI